MALFKTSGVDILGSGINIGAVYGTLTPMLQANNTRFRDLIQQLQQQGGDRHGVNGRVGSTAFCDPPGGLWQCGQHHHGQRPQAFRRSAPQRLRTPASLSGELAA